MKLNSKINFTKKLKKTNQKIRIKLKTNYNFIKKQSKTIEIK
jgi:hypothetical protein